MKTTAITKTTYLWGLGLIFLAGLFMRSASLGPMSLTMLHGDEAWNGVDIVELIQHPHFTPFLENNFGRESGWMYFQVPFVLAFGATPFALRFATVCMAMLTLAAASRLGRETFGARGALLMLATISVFYWHVHISQMALRINTYIFMACLAAAYLLHAYRTNRWTDWVVGGLCLGLLGYTYFASYGSIVFMGVLIVILATAQPKSRLAVLALVIALVVLLPMGTYVLQHPDKFFSRTVATATLGPAQVQANLQKWASAFFVAGDDNATFNYPFRPILGPVTGLLFLLGLVNFVRERRYRLMGLLTLCWGGVTVFPSLVTEYAPHFSRACGLIIPAVILMTNGLRWLGDVSARWTRRPMAALLPLVLLLPVGLSSYIDFHSNYSAGRRRLSAKNRRHIGLADVG